MRLRNDGVLGLGRSRAMQMPPGVLGGGAQTYSQKVAALWGASMIQWLKFDEVSGTVAADSSGFGNVGGYLGGFTLGQPGWGDGLTAVTLDGTNGRVNALPGGTTLATDFNGQEFTFHIATQISLAVWADGSEDEILKVVAGANSITIRKSTTANAMNFIYVAGGVTDSINLTSIQSADFRTLDLTISLANDQMMAYINGVQVGTTQTGLGTWAGTPTVIVVGAQNVAGATPLNGSAQHAIMLNRAATAQEVLSASSPFSVNIPPGFLALGDSKTYGTGDTNPPADGANGWVYILTGLSGWSEKPTRIAKSGWTAAMFAATIDGDVASAGGWVPNVVFVNLGTNDIEPLADPLVAGDWQANMGTILDTIHARWPGARVYVDKVWRRYNNGQMADLDDVWIPAVLSTRSWAAVGLDERDYLPSSDDGATYTTDGIHPNHAGYALLAQAKVALL